MKKIISLIVILLFVQTTKAQEEVKMMLDYRIKDQDLKTLLMFENIGFVKLSFKGKLKDRYYEINIKEFKNGKLTKIEKLFDAGESEYFKLKNDSLSLTLLTKNTDDQLILQIKGKGFFSKKLIYDTFKKNGDYALKDFSSREQSYYVPNKKPFPIFGIITPTRYPDGSSSYCEVAQSGVNPEDLGEKFNIPHYFIIEMKFK